MRIIIGSHSPALGKEICENLETDPQSVVLHNFPDTEMIPIINDNGVRGKKVYIIQSTSAYEGRSVSDAYFELCLIADAARRSSAAKIAAITPYFGYGRQDRQADGRTSIGAKFCANMMVSAGIQQVIAVDIHARQIGGFFDIPVDLLRADWLLAEDIREKHIKENPVIVSPDEGGLKRARSVADHLGLEATAMSKERSGPGIVKGIGMASSVNERHCIIVDDMIDTAGTLGKAAQTLMDQGAKSVRAYAVHGLFSGNAEKNIGSAPINEVVVTNSVGGRDNLAIPVRKISIAKMLAKAIKRINQNEPLSTLYNKIDLGGGK